MIVRKYGRRNRSLTGTDLQSNGYEDDVVVSEPMSISQECPQDIYDFTFSSQGSTHCHWSDSYGLNCTQDSRKLTILPTKKGREAEDFDCDEEYWRPKKVTVIDVDSEPNSSQEERELTILSSGSGRDKGVFEFSDGDFWESQQSKSVDSDPYGVRGILQPRNVSENGNSWDLDGVSGEFKQKSSKPNGGLRKKVDKSKKKKVTSKESDFSAVVARTTLMETQEFGEMMEHMDEVNFSMDGLKRGQPVRVRRASLLSLLSICGTAQQRRLLRAHGITKKIIAAILELNLDDLASNLAAAALLYVLTSDGQDDHILDSPGCICFLMKLLKPLKAGETKERALTIGSKLLGICKDAGVLYDSSKERDSSFAAIQLKIQEMLINCKEIKPREETVVDLQRPELNPKWISLLTMEKACLSAISIEDTSGAVRKSGGSFKEKLRTLGGLNAVFEVARNCHSVMEGWVDRTASFLSDSKDEVGLESLVLLLKCLKIMENATFLSKENQNHLLGMKGNFDGQRAPRSFTHLILSLIKILSGVSLSRSSSSSSQDENVSCHSSEAIHASEMPLVVYNEVSKDKLKLSSSSGSIPEDSQCQRGSPYSSSATTDMYADPWYLKMRIESSTSGSCSVAPGNSNNGLGMGKHGSSKKLDNGKRFVVCGDKDFEGLDSQDPYAFDEYDFEPSKWDSLSGRKNKYQTKDSGAAICELENRVMMSQQESSNKESHRSNKASYLSSLDQEKSDVLGDCLLTAVKVLMNLTNDNSLGCQQIAACGGLEILPSLIAGHFPSFCSSFPPFGNLGKDSLSLEVSGQMSSHQEHHLSDQELDLLVAILGLLVNLVEKDGRNRSRLAGASVSLPNLGGSDEKGCRDVIPLLCSIFLANQGAGEAAEEGKCLSWEDEDSILQGEKEAEKMIVEAYAALLLAFLSTESKSIRSAIAQCLPNQNMAILVPVMERFVEFHLSLNMISPETHSTVLEVIESCRIP